VCEFRARKRLPSIALSTASIARFRASWAKPRRVLSSRSLLCAFVAERFGSPSPKMLESIFGPCRSRDFATAIRHAASFHPARSPALGLRDIPPDQRPEFVRTRRRRSISATTMRYVGTPLRVLRFLARGSGMNQFTLAAAANGCPSDPRDCERCHRDAIRFPEIVLRLPPSSERRRRTGRPPPSRGFCLFQGDRAPTQRRSNTPWSPLRACVALETPAAFRNDRGSDDEGCPAKGMNRATPRSRVALPTAVCEENRSAFPS